MIRLINITSIAVFCIAPLLDGNGMAFIAWWGAMVAVDGILWFLYEDEIEAGA